MHSKYHLVKEVIKKPRKTVSSRNGASTPVTTIREAVLFKACECKSISWQLNDKFMKSQNLQTRIIYGPQKKN